MPMPYITSFNASANIGNLFKKMFPDSSISLKVACGKTKMTYLFCFGIDSLLQRETVAKSQRS